MVKKIGILTIFFILSVFSYAEARDTKVIRISVTIPAIVGLNSPEATVSSFAENKIVNRDIITQTEKREGGKVVLKTVLIK